MSTASTTPKQPSAVWLVVLFVAGLLLVACGGNEKLVTRRDDLRARTVKIDPRNRLEGTEAKKPAWANPGVYLYDNLSYKYFVQLRTKSKNVPLNLENGTLIINGDRFRLTDCTSLDEEVQESERSESKLYTEIVECPLDKDMFKRIGKANEVRVKFNGKDGLRNAYFSDSNRLRYGKFYNYIERKIQEAERDRR